MLWSRERVAVLIFFIEDDDLQAVDQPSNGGLVKERHALRVRTPGPCVVHPEDVDDKEPTWSKSPACLVPKVLKATGSRNESA